MAEEKTIRAGITAGEVIGELVEAVNAVNALFHPGPFFIKKLGSPITVGDQEVIDKAFIALDSAKAKAEEFNGH